VLSPLTEKGMTQIQLIVAIVLTGILSYMALANFGSSSVVIKRMSLAKKIVADVRYAQEMAMSFRKSVVITVDVQNDSYSIQWQSGGYLKTPIGGRDFIVDIPNSDFVGVDITSTGFTGGQLTFDSSGRPLNGGNPLAAATALAVLDGTTSVKILPVTGRCSIEAVP